MTREQSNQYDFLALKSLSFFFYHLKIMASYLNEEKHNFPVHGVSTQLRSSGLVAHENSTFRNLALAVSGPFMA